MPFIEYAEFDAIGLAELVRNKEVQPSELLEESIRRIEAFNPAINAVVYKAYDMARAVAAQQDKAAPSGPLHGVPFLLKDILGDCQGMPSALSSRMLRERMMQQDCELVSRFRKAGLNFVGKSNTPEFGILPTTECAYYGPARNPWNLDYSTGGSSGGAAAAVASGMVPAAHGNDGGGSIRIPASCCGLVGLKPTRARNSLAPDFGELLSGLLDEHVLTRTVRDSAALLDATVGAEPGSPFLSPPPARPFLKEVGAPPGKLRIALVVEPYGGTPLDPECRKAVMDAAKLCESLGHKVEEVKLPIDNAAMREAFLAIINVSIARVLDDAAKVLGRPVTEKDVEVVTWGMAQQGKAVGSIAYSRAIATSHQVGLQMARFQQTYDVI
ncbi:MAG: amidase, partial [Pseudomonadota bacterium]